MEIGVFGQPSSSAAKWAGEGNTFAYLYEGETGGGSPGVAPDVWAARMVAGGIKKFVLQDAIATAAAGAIARGNLLGVVPGPPDPKKGGTPVYDEPERSGVTAQAFRDYAASLRANTSPFINLDRWGNFQGDKVTSGPPNLRPIPGSTLVNKQPYDVWTEQLEVVGFDWHVAARGYPVGLLVTAFERLAGWSGGKRVVALMERGPQTASDNPRYLSGQEILCQSAIAAAMGAHAVIGFYTREGHKTRPGGFSFDPRDAEQVAASIEANRFLRRFDSTPNATAVPQLIDVKMIRDPNTALMVRDDSAGYLIFGRRMVDDGTAWVTIEVNTSHTRTITNPATGNTLAPLGVLMTGWPTPSPEPDEPAPLPDGAPIVVTVGMWREVADALGKIGDALGATLDVAQDAKAAADFANARIDRIAQGAGRPPASAANAPPPATPE